MLKIQEKNFFKLIFGLGNKSLEDIKKTAAVYASAGVDMFDLTPSEEVYDALYDGIKNKSLNPENFYYCVSYSLGDDKHGRKAYINQKKCVQCLKCIKKCPQDAIKYDESNKKVFIQEEKCIGCGKCDFCKAISFSKQDVDIISKTKILKEKYKVDCIELHLSVSKTKDITKQVEKIKKSFPDMPISICVSREKFSDNKLRKLLGEIINIIGHDNFIFQADGRAMTGQFDNYASTLQAVAIAQITQDMNLNTLLSGGINSKTYELAIKCDVSINGISVGSYGRNLIKEEIQNPEFWYNVEVFNSALEKAKSLVNSVKK